MQVEESTTTATNGSSFSPISAETMNKKGEGESESPVHTSISTEEEPDSPSERSPEDQNPSNGGQSNEATATTTDDDDSIPVPRVMQDNNLSSVTIDLLGTATPEVSVEVDTDIPDDNNDVMDLFDQIEAEEEQKTSSTSSDAVKKSELSAVDSDVETTSAPDLPASAQEPSQAASITVATTSGLETTADVEDHSFFTPREHEKANGTDKERTPESHDPIAVDIGRIKALEMELMEAKNQIQELKRDASNNNDSKLEDNELLSALQHNLQQQMSLKAEAENRARIAETKLEQLVKTEQSHSEQLSQLEVLQENLQKQMSAKAEAENKARLVSEELESLKRENQELNSKLQVLEQKNRDSEQRYDTQSQELERVREQRDEQERKQIALTNRLNAAMKKEADVANLAEAYEDDIKAAEKAEEEAKAELERTQQEMEKLKLELDALKKSSEEKIHKLESMVADERSLNDDRKKKMKAFIETKTEELRQAKSEADSLRQESSQSNKSLVDLNNRYKQIHAQWVQAQTRNRELQRDLNKIKKDSENLHRVGDSLEMKLSKSATETEEHKSKRLAAKHELMTVLRTLEAEKEFTNKLRDSLKFTFTPKALSQQRLLQENLDDFEAQLVKLSTRLGKVLPPPIDSVDTSHNSLEQSDVDHVMEGDGSENTDVFRLISKLEYETQKVSKCIMSFASSIERMQAMIDSSGERTCYSALSEIFTTGTIAATPRGQNSGTTNPLRSIRSHNYGQVPHSIDH